MALLIAESSKLYLIIIKITKSKSYL